MTMVEAALDILANRMPQVILIGVAEEAWEMLRPLDKEASVLMDLWDPMHLNRGQPAESARVRRLEAGLALIEEGFRLEDDRGSALSMLLDWYIPEPVSGELSTQEQGAWVQVFEALHQAGQSLEASPVPNFEEWMARDTWGWLAGKAMFEPVARALLGKGILRIHVPARPDFRRWPKDPTAEVLDEGGFLNPSRYWAVAIRQGYPLGGTVGPKFIARAVEWDMSGEAVRTALGSGQVDVHLRLGGEGPVLGIILCSKDSDFVSPPALLALLEHDPSILNDLDNQGRSLHAVVLEYLAKVLKDAPGAMGMAFNQESLERIGGLVRAHRLSLRMEEELPDSGDASMGAGSPIDRDERL